MHTWDAYYAEERVMAYYHRRRSGFCEMAQLVEGLAPSRGAWLDIGCGPGELLRVVRERGWEACGIEPSRRCLEANAERLAGARVVHGAVEDRLPEFRGMRVVSMTDVFRYVTQPDQVLRQIRAALDPGGWVLIREGRAHFAPDELAVALRRAGFLEVRCRPSPLFVETGGGEVDSGPGAAEWMRATLKRVAAPATRLAFRLTAGRLLLGPNFLVLGRR
jgi:SAM-dependent methyltransferase